MEQQRNILLILFLTLSLFIFWSWESDKYTMAKLEEQKAQQAALNLNTSDATTQNIIKLKSNTLDISISLNGGDIVDAKLPSIKQELHKDTPFHLLMTDSGFIYQAQSGLAGKDGLDSKGRPTYTSEQQEYVLDENSDSITAVLKLEKDNVTYLKKFTIYKDQYIVDVSYDIVNNSDKSLSMAFYAQLKQTVDPSLMPGSNGSNFFVAGAYRGTAYSTQESRYEKETLDSIIDLSYDKNNVNVKTLGGWVSMIQHYFVSSWIGDPKLNNVIYTSSSNQGKDAIIGIRTESVNIDANSKYSFNNKLWVGPKLQDQMELIAPNLELTVDYGWLWFLSIPLFKTLEFIQGFIGNWGFSIILLTLIIRTLLFPLTKAQYTSMAKMRLLTPKMQELREKYKDDRQKLGQETMRLYKTEKVNPLGGCFPLLIQMPIFIALYWTLMESTELRHAPFILWIEDLSVYDPYFVTPILYGITMYFIQKMSPTPVTDPVQAKVIMAMPFIFTFMFCTFPAGLTIYWLVSNIFTILQQVIIYRSLEKRGLHVKEVK